MKILIAMSGGVDSAMSAKMLKEQGHEIVGCYMKLHKKPGYHEKNIEKVEKVCDFLGIKMHILDLEEKFNKYVYSPFIDTYKEGKTPNPCALCNKFIKFGELLKFAKSIGCQKLATGHYVQIENGLIKTARDPNKDQSYFIAQVPKEVLADMIFPLGDKMKSDIKEMAKNLPDFKEFGEQAESSEICFVDTTYIDILNRHYDTNLPGDVVDASGKIIGRHSGYMHYTIGKRRGFEVFSAHEPHFVLSIDATKNQIVVGTKSELEKSEVLVKELNMFVNESEFECEVKVRYRSIPLQAHVVIDDDIAKISLKQSAYGVASGQLAVFYRGDFVIGSGFIV
ncbi:tRNA 2-thiouridine(34) synthase MnmA [Campylobacter sp. RM16187]|uniref:tRNA 2-thiouridine(34) synthase MnmA n=1 Tax=Campylobacter sp. RM16187 TaxID=1660063 RepID=UPI0021B6A7CD|nr:tRNA 2-thiouridine(34) synthase MnmA [Campylobacter sp. RM16187]QKG28674.1 tRNA U34 2-thiouridylase [Campylobacter sp. RM16187]